MSELFRKKPLAAAAVLVPALLGASVAHAALEEIVVTAQKKAENLQEVPISVTAVTANSLDKTGITGTDELSVVVPNLQYGRQVSSATPFMRGIGTKNSSVGDEGSISTYVDGVYYSSMVASVMEFNNIERVEVLRGPQGTLFGRNATGGLIHVITKDPSHETSGKVKVGVGNYDTQEFGFYGTTGLSENVAADLSINYKDRDDGFGDNLVLGEDRKGDEQESYRAKVLVDLSDDTELTLSYLYATSASDVGVGRQQAPGVVGLGGAAVNTGDFQDINSENTPQAEARQNAYSAKLTHDFGDFELISTTAYYESDAFFNLDQESGPTRVFDFNMDTEESQFSQEFQINSTTDSAFQWTAGLYFMDAEAIYTDQSHVNFGPTRLAIDVTQDTKSYAIYGQGSYDFTDQTKLTLGLRWTRDEREVSGGRSVNNGPFVNDASRDESWEEPTWRVALDHQLTDDVLVYASYSRGFKSGVYNTVINLTGVFSDPVDPEILDAYEIGFKGDFFDSSLRVNASAFYYEVEDLQMQLIQGGAILLLNVGETEIMGAEVEATYFATDNLDFNFSLSLLDTEYTKFPAGPILNPNTVPPGGNIGGVFGDLKGNDLIRSPDYTYSLAANYRIPSDLGEFNVNVTYYYNDGFYWEPDNRLEQEDYDIVNAEVGLTSSDEKWFFRIFGRNLTDSEYSYYSQESSTGDLVSAAPPRTYGASAEYRF